MVRYHFLFLVVSCVVVRTSLQADEDSKLGRAVYKNCDLSGDGWIFCMGAKGGQVSHPSDEGGCFADKSCEIVVQGEQLRQKHSASEKPLSVVWQVFILNTASAPASQEQPASPAPVPEATTTTKAAPKSKPGGSVAKGSPTGKKAAARSLEASFRQQDVSPPGPEISVTFTESDSDSKFVNFTLKNKVVELFPDLCKSPNALRTKLPEVETTLDSLLPDDGGKDKHWHYYRFHSPRKLVCTDYSFNINLGGPEAEFSVKIGFNGGEWPFPMFRAWSEIAPGKEGTRRKDDNDDTFQWTDETSTFVAIAVTFIIIVLIIVGGLIYVFQRRAKRRRAGQLSTASGLSSYSTTSSIKPKASTLSKPRETPISTDLDGKLAARRLSSLSRHQTVGSDGPNASGVKAGSSKKY
jgi:hypothetical protein